MKNLIWLLILALVVVGAAQMVKGALRRVDFAKKLHAIAMQVMEKNHDEIKREVVGIGTELQLQFGLSDVKVQYAPTSEMNFAQRMVSRVGTFRNHRATITVEYAQPVLFITLKHTTKATALIESAAEARRLQKIPE